MAQDTKPQTAQGGCVCKGVRYTMTFPADHDFSHAVSTCQCEQCRKNTGALIFTAYTLPTSSLNFTSDGSLRRFYATPGIARGFCGSCGGLMFWHDESGDTICLAVGTLDKGVLREHGPLLTKGARHLWYEDAIPGVTDNLEGQRWKHDSEGAGAELMP